MPLTLPANQISEIQIEMSTGVAGEFTQQLHFYLDLANTLVQKQIDVVGMATEAYGTNDNSQTSASTN